MTIEENDKEIFVNVTLEKRGNECCPNCKSSMIVTKDYSMKKLLHKHFTGKKCTIIWKRRRYKCKECGKTFFEFNPFCLDEMDKVSTETVLFILEELAEVQAFKSVALKTGLSESLVARIFDKYVNIPREKMPEVLGIDEFHNKSTGYGKYACILINNSAEHPSIIDIIEERTIDRLSGYFQYIEKDELNNVKFFVSDMYEGYRTIHDVYFPKSVHVVDTFHFLRLFTEAVNRVRIRIMKTYKTDSEEYYILKKYYYILIKSKRTFRKDKIFYPHFNRYMNQYDLLKVVLNVSEELREAYILKDYFCSNYYKVKEDKAEEFLNNEIELLKECRFEEFRQVANSLGNWKKEILNSFKLINGKRITNARTEGFNNLVKVIKRSGYGYRNFIRFRNRILHIQRHNKNIKVL